MNDAQLNDIEQWYHAFVDRYHDGGWLPMHQMKYEHTLRVADNAEAIARGSGWDRDRVNAARAAAMLHDVGRFPQFVEYGTFYDPQSCNHALRSFQVVQAEGLLRELEPPERDAIEHVIRIHNGRVVPDDLPSRTRELLMCLRDADKIDIIRVVGDAVDADDRAQLSEMVWELDLDAPLSDDLLGEFAHDRNFCYTKLKSLADTQLLHLSWIWSIAHAAAMALIAERGVIERLERHLGRSPGVARIVADAIAHRDKVLSKRNEG